MTPPGKPCNSRTLAAGAACLFIAGHAVSPARAALLTNFAASYALYEQATQSLADADDDGDVDGVDFIRWQRGMGSVSQVDNSLGDADRNTVVNGIDHDYWKSKFGFSGGLPNSVVFKLYFDPVGITQGQVTAVLDVQDFGLTRFATGLGNGLFQVHPQYEARIVNQNYFTTPDNHQRLEIKVNFNARNPLNPPAGPVTIFGLQLRDLTPFAGPQGVQASFDFNPGDFITTYDTTTQQTNTFSDAQLFDQPLLVKQALLEPGDPILAIDTSALVSNSAYGAGQSPAAAMDGNASSKYRNTGRRNTGFIATLIDELPQNIQSMVIRTANDLPQGDPTSWQVYGTNDAITSQDNSEGDSENWVFIAGGTVALPDTRGTLGPVISFPNSLEFHSYRVVFPNIKDFRSTTAMQVADVGLFTSTAGTGSNKLVNSTNRRAIQRPTSQADSPPTAGPENAIDGLAYTRYRNFGKELAGFIVSPTWAGATVIDSFMLTTANDVPNRDPMSWEIYGTNDPIVSQNFSQGTDETWTYIDGGVLVFTPLPDTRLEVGALIDVNNFNQTPYRSYRLIFPSLKNSSASGVDSVQIGEVQFFGDVIFDPAVPAPEPTAGGLLAWCAVALSAARKSRFSGTRLTAPA